MSLGGGRSATSKFFDFGHKVVVFALVSFSAITIFDVGRGMYKIIRINRQSLPPPPPPVAAAPLDSAGAGDNINNGNAKA
jgi:hypothetical protein